MGELDWRVKDWSRRSVPRYRLTSQTITISLGVFYLCGYDKCLHPHSVTLWSQKTWKCMKSVSNVLCLLLKRWVPTVIVAVIFITLRVFFFPRFSFFLLMTCPCIDCFVRCNILSAWKRMMHLKRLFLQTKSECLNVWRWLHCDAFLSLFWDTSMPVAASSCYKLIKGSCKAS